MQVLLLGAGGFLGGELKKVLEKKEIKYLAPGRNNLDVLTPQLEKMCRDYKPTVILNAVAYTNVDGAEAESDAAYALNADLPERLAKVAKEIGALLVHFSTDYVFDGENEQGYAEEDKPRPLSVYGKSKHQGEKVVQEFGEKFWIVRTSFPFGDNEKCFLQRVRKLAEEKETIKMLDSLVCAPTDFAELAERVIEMLSENYVSGIYHLTNFGSCSRYEFTKEVLRILKIKTKLVKLEVVENEGARAERPKFSVLLNTKLSPMLPWSEALEKYLLRK